ncbi:PTS sugar transporter subunit IIA [Anianabacter salinae]|uniref:PTS sugar transporter subunit IIA n=1 Tax=Anianabacter salinae TaxID=2851023 RepID=UPI00225E0308|nr:PTS sugar transporter subunit IIA [Anianabacter salinae]MBV0913581.1 PTS sugar transporter subunit IIA [Anianabacter salinae]
MNLSTLLQPSAVKVATALTSKKRLFHALGDLAHAAYGLDAAIAVSALQEREALGPTGVGNGVALPHARIDDLTCVRGVFLRLEKPIDFTAVDRQPVDLVFGLFAPENSGVDHLKALALVSRTLRDPGVCAKLRANADPSILHAILTEGPAIQAA